MEHEGFFLYRFYHTLLYPVHVLTQCSLRSILILSSQMATKDTLFRNCELRLAGVHYLIYRSLRLKCIIADHHDSGSRVGLHPVSRGGITVIITCMDGQCWSFPSDVRSWSQMFLLCLILFVYLFVKISEISQLSLVSLPQGKYRFSISAEDWLTSYLTMFIELSSIVWNCNRTKNGYQ